MKRKGRKESGHHDIFTAVFKLSPDWRLQLWRRIRSHAINPESVVDLHHWLNLSEFTDLVTISQMTPGPIAINSATFVGTRIAGAPGALAATVGCVLPSCILVTLLARIYLKYRDLSIIQGVLKSLRPAVVAMIGAAGVSILVTAFWGLEGFSPNLSALNLRSVCIFAGAVVLLVRFRMSPILVMVLSGAAETACQLVMRVL